MPRTNTNNKFFILSDLDDAKLIYIDVNKNICGLNTGKILKSNNLLMLL